MNFAVMGFGTVGSGVVELFYKNRDLLEKRTGQKLDMKHILDLREFPGSPYESLFTKSFDDILKDDSVKIVAEAMGGVEPAYSFTKACLESGKSVVTSNKELVAKKGGALLKIAKAHNCNYFFEASVGGGVPVLRPLHICLAANHIQEVAGVLNGTTNFILTKMIGEQMPFARALSLAQEQGYAERDPSADIEGHDACRKICILADMAFGQEINPEDVSTQGISDITMEDVSYASSCGSVVKLIGCAKQKSPGSKVTAFVSPAFVSGSSQLGTVSGVFNGILVRGDAVGDVVFYGQGAGKLPTASALIADMLDCTLLGGNDASLGWESSAESPLDDLQDHVTAIYFRFANCTTELAREVFGSDMRLLTRSGQPKDEIAIVSEAKTERKQAMLQQEMERRGASILGKIRVLDYK